MKTEHTRDKDKIATSCHRRIGTSVRANDSPIRCFNLYIVFGHSFSLSVIYVQYTALSPSLSVSIYACSIRLCIGTITLIGNPLVPASVPCSLSGPGPRFVRTAWSQKRHASLGSESAGFAARCPIHAFPRRIRRQPVERTNTKIVAAGRELPIVRVHSFLIM